MTFERLAGASPTDAAATLLAERKQTAAYVLTRLGPEKAAAVLSVMPPDVASDVLLRMREGREPVEWAVEVIERELERDSSKTRRLAGGPEYVAKTINKIEPELLKRILVATEDEESGRALRDDLTTEKLADINLTGEKYELS